MTKSKKLSISALVLAVVMMLACVSLPVFADDTYVAEITKDGVTTQYTSLKDAVAAAERTAFSTKAAPTTQTTIKLLTDTNAGLDIGKTGNSSGYIQNIVLDLSNHTLTLGPAIGSKNTETNGLRVLPYSKLEIKNGTIVPSELANNKDKYVIIAFANYGTMVLDDVTVNSSSKVEYTINNRGDLTLSGNTTVPSGQAGAKIAITNDVYNKYYDTKFDTVLNIASSDVEVGVVGIEKYAANGKDGDIVLNISSGKVEEIKNLDEDTATTVVGNVTGGTFTKPVAEEYLADGLEAVPDGNGGFVVEVPHTHSYGTPKANDAKTHTAKCECGATFTSEHSIKDGACTDCGYKAGSIVPSDNPETSNESGMGYAAVLMLAGLVLAVTLKKCR